MKNCKFSVIIPAKQWNRHLDETITSLLKGSFKDFEIIILPDSGENNPYPKTQVIPTGNVGPAKKRDMGAKIAEGEFLAFIDDDAYPSENWLKTVLSLFKDDNIAAVCGPGITPPNDNVFQKVSGWVSSTKIGMAANTYRFIPEKERFVDDYPSMNLIIRKTDFNALGGFDTNYWPGEDTKLCLDIVKILKKKIIYHPGVLVFHHRRPIFKEHLLQNGRYGLHRGYFAKILPETSFRFSYLPPPLFTIGFFIGPLFYYINKNIFLLYLLIIFSYFFMILITSFFIFVKEKNILIALLFIPAVVATHLFYGVKFLQGFFLTTKLKR